MTRFLEKTIKIKMAKIKFFPDGDMLFEFSIEDTLGIFSNENAVMSARGFISHFSSVHKGFNMSIKHCNVWNAKN